MQACQVSLETTSRGDLVDSGGTVQNLNNLIAAGSGCQIQAAAGINGNGPIVADDTATG